jgi:hypothetical protein
MAGAAAVVGERQATDERLRDNAEDTGYVR